MTDTSALIEGHHLVTAYPAAWCQCHWPLRWEHREQDHSAHVIAAIQAQALREAADVWQRGAWADAPRRADRVQERIANGEHVSEWLRERAARLASTTEETTT